MTDSNEAYLPLPEGRLSARALLAQAEARRSGSMDPTPVEPGSWPTAAQYAYRWAAMSDAERLTEAEHVLGMYRDKFYRAFQPMSRD